MLSKEQITRLELLIGREKIGIPGLADDLLDHLCCSVEEIMEEGFSFEEALPAAYIKIFPGGIKEIEEDVISILTPNTKTAMKKAIYAAGFVSAFLISTGLLFRFMHWPPAAILLSLGFLVLLLGVVPLVIVVTSRDYAILPAAERARIISGVIAAALISSGMFFKVQHWPSANIQFVSGMFVLNVFFLPLLFYKLYKRTTN